MLIDSHCHLHMLDLTPYQGDMSALIAQAKNEGVENILNVCTKLTDINQLKNISNQFPNVYSSIGLHPDEDVEAEPTLQELIQYGKDDAVIAIGETGLDYYRVKENQEQMRERFRTHIRAALALKKPLIIHTREAEIDTIKIMQEEQAQQIRGVMHCFTGSYQMAQQAMELGFYISFSGILTFKNAKEIAELAIKIPLEKILIETDAPFLTPVPFRGKKSNEPQYVKYVAERIAELKNISFTQVAEQTTYNFKKLFKL